MQIEKAYVAKKCKVVSLYNHIWDPIVISRSLVSDEKPKDPENTKLFSLTSNDPEKS